MRYEVRHYETAHMGREYDTLICFEYDGYIKSMAYIPECYPSHVVIEAITNKIAAAYMVGSDGGMYSLTLTHVSEIKERHTVLRKLLEQIEKDAEVCPLERFDLACELNDMSFFIKDIIVG